MHHQKKQRHRRKRERQTEYKTRRKWELVFSSPRQNTYVAEEPEGGSVYLGSSSQMSRPTTLDSANGGPVVRQSAVSDSRTGNRVGNRKEPGTDAL